MKVYLMLLVLFTFFVRISFGQEFEVQKLDINLVNEYRNSSGVLSLFNSLKGDAFRAIKSLPKDFVEDGSVDYTFYIQEALNRNQTVLMPDFPISINDKGLTLNSGQNLLFQTNTFINLIPTSKSGYNILRIYGVEDVNIFYANIEGDRYSHLSSEGQWGFGIGIKGARNVCIYSPYIRKTWGDGIYIGQQENIPSENVFITHAIIDDVRRNGISITSAKNIEIVNSFISNTNGQSPESGLDIEPNSIHDEVTNIDIRNLTTYNNKWSGILMVFEKFKSHMSKSISINIDGHVDTGSTHAISFHGYRNDVETKNLSGFINLHNVDYSKSTNQFFFYRTSLSNLKINTSVSELEFQFNKLISK